MEPSLLDDMNKRIVRSFLDAVVLLELSKQALSGSDVVALIHEKYKMMMSAGTVYSCLYNLEREGLLKSKSVSRKSVFVPTERGANVAKELLEAKPKVLELLSKILS